MKPNIRLLRRIQRKILAEPKQFHIYAWFQGSPEIPNCQTAACIAGWAVTLTEGVKPLKMALKLDKTFKPEVGDYIGGDYAKLGAKADDATLLVNLSPKVRNYFMGELIQNRNHPAMILSNKQDCKN